MSQLLVQPEVGAAPTPDQRERQKSKVAYLVSRFPKLTETFVLYELLAVEREGLDVELYALQRERTSLMHPEARALLPKVHFARLVSVAIVAANMAFLFRKPRVYVTTLFGLLRATFGSTRYFLGAIAFFPKTVYFARQMRSAGVTHVHAHFASHPAAMAWVIRRLTGISFSFTAHGSDLHRDKRMLRQKTADADFVASISDYNRQAIIEHCGPAAKIHVVHCGVDTDVFIPQSGSEAAWPPDQLTIVCTGTLHEVKGQRYLIEACRLLGSRGCNVHCHLIGDGPDENALRQQADRAAIADNITFHGRRTRDEVAKLLATADVVAAPSVPTADGRREGIPVALMEAMASGRAVVASRLSGIPELVRDDETGLLVPPGDAEALADALERLQQDSKLRERLALAARTLVEDEFDLQKNARHLANKFVELCSRRNEP